MIVGIIITLIVTIPIAFLWARAIDKMPKDYKGEDFLNWDRQDDDWDKAHTEDKL
jgi:hypothetical protein